MKTTRLLLAIACLFGANSPAILESPPTYAQDLDIYTLTSIDYEEGTPLPEEVTALDETEVAISGYMHLFQGESDRFLLLADPCACAGRPKIHEFVEITLSEETTWSPSLVRVEGLLRVGEEYEDEFVTSLYRLDGDLD